jgi:hypothetical protein
MEIHMKTTLVIDDGTFKRLKRAAAQQGTTLSALVEAALRQFLARREAPAALPPLPSFDGGGALVDLADREALYQAMEGR